MRTFKKRHLVVKVSEISEEEAKQLIIEARSFTDPDEIVAYSQSNIAGHLLHRLFSMPVPPGGVEEDDLLEYVRNNIPDNTVIDLV